MRLVIFLILLAPSLAFADDGPPDIGVATQEIGARLGAQVSLGGLSPGGLRVGGVYLYRMTSDLWFDGEASVAFGGGGNHCILDRDLAVSCDPGPMDGFGIQVGIGVRWFPNPPAKKDGVNPYVRAGIGFDIASFSADGVTGVGIPVYGGAGARIRVTDRVAVSAEALVSVGPGFFNQGLGTSAYGRIVVQGGVELAL